MKRLADDGSVIPPIAMLVEHPGSDGSPVSDHDDTIRDANVRLLNHTLLPQPRADRSGLGMSRVLTPVEPADPDQKSAPDETYEDRD